MPAFRTSAMKVFVHNLALEAEIGVYPHERGRAQPLVLEIELDVTTANVHRLSETINYETIAKTAQALVAEGHVGLVETFAEQLARALMADERVTSARIRVEKPLALAPATAGVEVVVVRS
jgi:7,8-dihydroneopterin aldolase/epimerase/oxygenase